MLLTIILALSFLPFLVAASSHQHRLKHDEFHHDDKLEFTARQPASGNKLMIQGFEWYVIKDSQHWNRLNGQLGKLAGIGIDKIWIPPATKANTYYSTGYDVYDLWDLGEFYQKEHIATSYGTKAELIALSQNANALGITLLADGVLNQRSGADGATPCWAHKVNPTNRLETISGSQMIFAWVDFNFPGRNGKYSKKTWTCGDFTAVDYDDNTKEKAVWKMEGTDNGFATDVSIENGNYDYLMLADVAYHNPFVQEDVKAWGSWIVDQLDLAGFRLDAAKHISQEFFLDWITNIKAQTGRRDLLFIAEYLTHDPAVIQDFANKLNNTVSVFDTPLQIKFHKYSTGEDTDLSAVLDYTWLSTQAEQATLYTGNHDTQLGQALDHLSVQGWFLPLAYALILLREAGYPCLFYGDLYGTYDDTGIFTAPQYPKMVADLALARKYFAYGTQKDYFDDTSVIGWTRQGQSDHPEGLAIIMSNAQGGGDQTKTMNVGVQHAGEIWSSLFGGTGALTIGKDGSAEFVAGAGTVNVYTRADASQRSEFGSWTIEI